MRNNKWMMASLLGGALLLTVGCVKEKSVETGGIPGTPIVFAAATSYVNNDATRTEYSGHVYGATANEVERIDWVSNSTHKDQFTVNYVAGSSSTSTADYTVTKVDDSNNSQSYAQVDASDRANILAWADGSDHKFYAMYPPKSVNSTVSLTKNTTKDKFCFKATLPALQPQTHTQLITVDGKEYNRRLPDMNNAFMLAYAGTDNGMVTGGGVTLPFRPAVTTFEFRLQREDGQDGANIRSFELCSVGHALTGEFSVFITGGNERGATWNESEVEVERQTADKSNSVITVDFGAGGVTLPTDGTYLDFTVFAVPKNLSDLYVVITDINGIKRKLPLKDKVAGEDPENPTYHEFTGAKKYVIFNSNVPGDWEYVIDASEDIVTSGHNPVDNLPFTVKSYKKSGSKVVPVPWKLQYSLDGGSTWADFNSEKKTAVLHGPGPSPIDWNLSFYSNILGGLGTGNLTDVNNGYFDLLGTSDGRIEGDEAAAAQRAKLASAPPRGMDAGEGPFDLSTHPVYGEIDTPVAQTTANSYVISAPGLYMFPCVYGNGISNGLDNKSAYWPGAATDAGVSGEESGISNLKQVMEKKYDDAHTYRAYTPRFYNALNGEIKSAYIFDDLAITSQSAVVVWQDTDADNGDIKHQIIPFTSDHIGLTTKTINGKTVDYIWFKVDADRIQSGNFVIALMGKAGTLSSAEILWSWHIWVTPDDLSPTDEIENAGVTYKMMPKNLGWFDSNNGSTSEWPTRSMKFRAVQTEAYGKDATNTPLYKDDSFYVTQRGDADTVDPTVGGNVYYQWGRKDPFLPVVDNGVTSSNHPVVYNTLFASRVTIKTDGIKEEPANDYFDFSASIRAPYLPYKNDKTLNWVGGPVYPFLKESTGTYIWRIMPGHEKTGPFTEAQKNVLDATDFSDPGDWRAVTCEVNDFYHNGVDFYMGPYSDGAKANMLANGFVESDFTGSSGNWNLTYKKLGKFTLAQATAINQYWIDHPAERGHLYNDGYHWVPITVAGTYYFLLETVEYNHGTYTQPEALSFVQAGIFTAGVVGSGCDMEGTPVVTPYPASDRMHAANVTNIWNAYAYDEETDGDSYTNKFKTIYDPCPPGFTVPVKQVFVGNKVFTDADRETNANSMHMKKSDASEVFSSMSPTIDITSVDAKGLYLGSIYFPFTGARVFRDAGEGNVLHAECFGKAGYYWSDSPLNMDWRFVPGTDGKYEERVARGEPVQDPYTLFPYHWFYFDAYGLIFGKDFDGYVNDTYRVQSYSRASALSIRPMKDPKYQAAPVTEGIIPGGF